MATWRHKLVSLLEWLQRRRYRVVESIAGIVKGRVEVEGEVEAMETLQDPLTGEACVAIDYRAWPPSTTIGMDGATAHNSRAFLVSARQAVNFVLTDGYARALVRVPAGDDVGAVHGDLLARYGVGLRTELQTVPEGARVRVAGRVSHATGKVGSPHRAEPYTAIIDADRFWLTGS